MTRTLTFAVLLLSLGLGLLLQSANSGCPGPGALCQPLPAAAPSGSAWSLSDKGSGINTPTTTVVPNDTASANSTSWALIRGTQSYASGSGNKKVFVLTITTSNTNGWIGGVDSGGSLSSYLGSGPHAFGVQAYTTAGGTAGSDYRDSVMASTSTNVCATGGLASNGNPAIFAQGGTMWFAIDFTSPGGTGGANRVFCSKDCVNWIFSGGSTGSPDNATTTPVWNLSAGTYLPAWSGENVTPNSTAIINTKPSLTGCSNITTFSQWG